MDSLGLILTADDEKDGQEMMSPLEVMVFKTFHLPLLFNQIPGSSGGQRSPFCHRDLKGHLQMKVLLPFVMTFFVRDGEREKAPDFHETDDRQISHGDRATKEVKGRSKKATEC